MTALFQVQTEEKEAIKKAHSTKQVTLIWKENKENPSKKGVSCFKLFIVVKILGGSRKT